MHTFYKKKFSLRCTFFFLHKNHEKITNLHIGLVARFMHQPHESHWKEAKRIFRYIRGTVQFGIHYSEGASPLLIGFTDFDCAGDPDDQKSTAGYAFTLGSGPITWSCKKQSAISLSSAKVEYHGAVEASKEAMWLRQILFEFGLHQQHPTHFGVIIRVPFSYVKIQFNISI